VSTSARTASGDLQLPRVIVSDFNSVTLQTVIDRLNLWKGEWFLDLNAGFPWAQAVLGVVPANPTKISALLRQALLQVPGVKRVVARGTFNGSTRKFSYTFFAYLQNNALISGSDSSPPAITGAA
jgi:hypothetical protein